MYDFHVIIYVCLLTISNCFMPKFIVFPLHELLIALLERLKANECGC
jgi:hypothetical protein